MATKTVLKNRHNGDVLATYEPPADYTTLRYDYAQVDAQYRTRVQDAAVEIRRREKRMVEDVLIIGQRLLEVKDAMPGNLFGAWLHEEFNLTHRMAQNFMNASRVYGNEKGEIISLLNPTTLYLLSAPNVPESARIEVEQIATIERRRLGVEEVKQLIVRHVDVSDPAPTVRDQPTPIAPPEPPPAPPPAPLPDTDMPPDLKRAGYWLEQYPAGEWGWRTSISGDAPYSSRDQAITGARKDLASKSNDAMPTFHGLVAEPEPEVPPERVGSPAVDWVIASITDPATPTHGMAANSLYAAMQAANAEQLQAALVAMPDELKRAREPVILAALRKLGVAVEQAEPEPEPEPEPIHPFEAWIASMPPVTGLYECRLLVELGQFGAQRARRLDGDMRRFVDDLEMPTRLLIGKLNRKAKGQP